MAMSFLPGANNLSNITNSSSPWHHIYGLEENCREDWPVALCVCFNICGLTSTAIWFLVLLPQLFKNFNHKSVVGLSLLWATIDFTAALINMCFVYGFGRDPLPLYIKIQAIYMPTIGILLLIQFFRYGKDYKINHRIAYIITSVVMWSLIIVVDYVIVDAYKSLQWIAIVLWSIELIPQIILNIKRGSTSGQSTSSVMLAVAGRTTDFFSTYGLVMPIQYVSMMYFTSTLTYINAAEIVWYYGKGNNTRTLANDVSDLDLTRDRTESNISTGSVEITDPDDQTEQTANRSTSKDSGTTHSLNPPAEASMVDVNLDGTFTGNFIALRTISTNTQNDDEVILFNVANHRHGFKSLFDKNYVRYILLAGIAVVLIFFAAAFVWRVQNFLVILGPIIIFIVIVSSKFILDRMPTSISYKLFK